MRRIARLLVIVFGLPMLLVGCASAPPLATESGRPEVFIPNKTTDQVMQVAVKASVSNGARVLSSSPYSVVLAKPIDGVMAGILFGSTYDATPEGRLTYTAVAENGGVRVYATFEVITNPGSAFERRTDFTVGQGKTLQDKLEQLRSKMESVP